MARTRLTSVVGEQELIVGLVALITRADDQIARMAAGAAGPRRSCMTTLEGILAEPEWTVARACRQRLRARKDALDAVTASVTEEYRSLQLNFERLHHVVERASELRYDDAASEAELALDVVGKFRTSDLDFRSGRYDTAAVAVQHAKRRLAEKGLTLPRGHPDERDPDQVDVAQIGATSTSGPADTTRRRSPSSTPSDGWPRRASPCRAATPTSAIPTRSTSLRSERPRLQVRPIRHGGGRRPARQATAGREGPHPAARPPRRARSRPGRRRRGEVR